MAMQPSSTQGQQRQGSQGTSKAAPRGKILRIGVILGDKIVEERLIRDRGPVTVGQSAKNTFSVPATELPKSWTLFEVRDGKYILAIADSMDGRLSEGGQVSTIAQLKSSGTLQQAGPGWLIPLTDATRGKIIIGEMTLLFQFVTAPPIQPRARLPHSVRGSFADRIDPYLAVILSVSLVVHGLFWAYAKFIVEDPVPPPPADRFTYAEVKLKPPAAQMPKPIAAKEPDKAATPTEAPKPEESKKPRAPEPPKPTAPPQPAAAGTPEGDVSERVARAAPLKVLNQLAGKGNGPLGDVTGDKSSWEDLDKGLAKVGSGSVVASVGTTHGQTTRGTAAGDVAAGKEVGVTGPTGPAQTTAEKVEKEIKIAGNAGKIEDIESNGLDPDKVASTIKSRYQARVNACYQRALKTNANLGGKVTVSFTVGVAGNVIKASAEGFDPGVDECITREARTWRFDKPEAPAVFEIPFILRRLN